MTMWRSLAVAAPQMTRDDLTGIGASVPSSNEQQGFQTIFLINLHPPHNLQLPVVTSALT